MRMTRAALRAQEAEDDLHCEIEAKLKEQGIFQLQSDAGAELVIHADEDALQDEEVFGSNEADSGRAVLRDITSENYPVALADTTVDSTNESEELEGKGIKKAKSKGKKGGPKKRNAANRKQPEVEQMVDDSASEQPLEDSQATCETIASESFTPDESVEELESSHNESKTISEPENTVKTTKPDLSTIPADAALESGLDAPESGPADAQTTPSKATDLVPKTPKFDPEIHLSGKQFSDSQCDSTEDSFVDSIKTRSPSKLSQPVSELPQKEQHQDISSQAQSTQTPGRKYSASMSQSPQRIEDSVEAIDALEDAIEKFAEDLPVIEAFSFESPIRTRKTPSGTPGKVVIKTPAKTPAQISVRTLTRTPARPQGGPSAKLAAKVSTPKISTPAVTKTSSNFPSGLEKKMMSVKRETVRERVKALEAAPVTVPHRRTTSVHVLKKEAPVVKQTVKSRHMATKSVSVVEPLLNTSMSFSTSPIKTTAMEPKKRVTSGGVLSTSKPGFVPAKSTKPVTTSTFTLPGEAVSAKLKAQREERQKREEVEAEKKTTFKAKPAPSRTARPSVMPRENRASAARMGVRQASGENKENVEPARSSSSIGATNSVVKSLSKTRSTANSSVRRTTVGSTPASTVASRKSMSVSATSGGPSSQRISSLTSGQQVTLSKAEAAQQKIKGKEVYGRIRGSVQQQEDERKAKEEAARKARAEAAERGRQASREWAEKQKKKLAAGKVTTLVEATS